MKIHNIVLGLILFLSIIILSLLFQSKNTDNMIDLSQIQHTSSNFNFVSNQFKPEPVPVLPKCKGSGQCV